MIALLAALFIIAFAIYAYADNQDIFTILFFAAAMGFGFFTALGTTGPVAERIETPQCTEMYSLVPGSFIIKVDLTGRYKKLQFRPTADSMSTISVDLADDTVLRVSPEASRGFITQTKVATRRYGFWTQPKWMALTINKSETMVVWLPANYKTVLM